MKIRIFFFVIFYLMSSCSIKDNDKTINENYNFSDSLTFDQMKSMLEKYSEVSPFPILNE
tara:strand:- start:1233 stop:1412 length:180 start_codon:yes stop_codon:yes gene_type:complete